MQSNPEENEIRKDKKYWDERQNLFGFFQLLREVDMRMNPHLYQKQKTKKPSGEKIKTNDTSNG